MSLYYDRKGKAIGSAIEWALLHDEFDYTVVRQTHTANGYLVSTVWLGLDHSFRDDSPPIIFETMVFKDLDNAHHGREHGDMARYATEQAARIGHERILHRARMRRRPR
jgi:hypothetical protein